MRTAKIFYTTCPRRKGGYIDSSLGVNHYEVWIKAEERQSLFAYFLRFLFLYSFPSSIFLCFFNYSFLFPT